MASITSIPGEQAPTTEPTQGRRRALALTLVVLLVLGLLAVAVAWSRGSASADQASLLADQATTKTYQELERQAALPASERSLDALSWAIATPQSDRTGPVWTTDVLRAELSGTTLTARVAAALAVPGAAPTYYLEYVVTVVEPTDPGTTPGVTACAARYGDSTTPATGTVAITSHLVLPACDADTLQRAGVTR